MHTALSVKQSRIAFVFGILLLLATSVGKAHDFTGRGQKASRKFTLDTGLYRFQMKHDGKSNFAVILLDSEGDTVELLVNTIGKFDGSKAVGIKRKGTYLLDISADGRWSVSTAKPKLNPTIRRFSAHGQEASHLFTLDAGLHVFRMKHDGKSNFAVILLDSEGDTIELLVNTIGKFDGSKAVGIKRKGNYLIDISADGNWTVAIE